MITSRGEDFETQRDYWLRECMVISNPEAIVVTQPIRLDDGREAWMVNAAAGNLKLIVRMFPFWKPWVAFDRAKQLGAPLKIYSSERLWGKVSGFGVRGSEKTARAAISPEPRTLNPEPVT